MASNRESVTQLALKVLYDNDLLFEQCSLPEDVVEYIQDEKHFKSLAELLKETMIQAGICNEGDAISIFVDALCTRLQIQDRECGRPEKSNGRKTIRDWLSGNTKSIRMRDDAIEICFALKLNLEATTNFLYKSGFSPLNVRDAHDAVYLYCIMSGRSLNVAQKLISKYETATMTDLAIPTPVKSNHSGNTTILLQRELENMLHGIDGTPTNWEDDDSFFNTFLIPNRTRFLGYATTAEKEYYLLKNKAFIAVIEENFRYFAELREGEENSVITQQSVSLLESYERALAKCDESHILYPLNRLEKPLTFKSLAYHFREGELKRIYNEHQDRDAQKEIAAFLNNILTNESFLKSIVKCIRNQISGRQRGARKSIFIGTVMKEFPRATTFANFEKEPAKAAVKTITRKAIILMYFFFYAYSASLPLSSSIDSFGTFDLAIFMDGLNEVLRNCRFSQLYVANQFDWLILRCVRELELTGPYDMTSPMPFFNNVLAFSFGDDPDDDDD